MRNFTYIDYCAWRPAYVIDDAGNPERVSVHWSARLSEHDHRFRFCRANGQWEEANLSDGLLKADEANT